MPFGHFQIFVLQSGSIQLKKHRKKIYCSYRNSFNQCLEELVAHHLFDCPELCDIQADFFSSKPLLSENYFKTGEQ